MINFTPNQGSVSSEPGNDSVEIRVRQRSSTPASASSAPNKRQKGNHKGSNSTRHRCVNACNRCKVKKLKCNRVDESSLDCAPCQKASEACVFEDIVMRPGYPKYIIALENRCAKLEKALADINPNHPEVNDHYISEGHDHDHSSALSSDSQHHPPLSTKSATQGPASHSHSALSGLLSSHSSISYTSTSDTHSANLSAVMQPTSQTTPPANPNPVIPPNQIANSLLDTVHLHLQCRYPFLDWTQIYSWHSDRDHYLKVGVDGRYEDQTVAFFLWMVYAVGNQLDPTLGIDSAHSYFEQAWKYSSTVTTPHNLTTVRVLLLTTFYAFRATSGPSLWLYGGLAMRLCVELGLHKKDMIAQNTSDKEWNKRVFWSAYTFDRLISHGSGRPVSIADEAIDVEMPLDISTSVTQQPLGVAVSPNGNGTPAAVTDMTSAIMSIRMYRIRSRIHAALPSLKNPKTARELRVAFLIELEDWRRNIPKNHPGADNIPMQAEDRFRWRYFLCVLLVLRPAILNASPSDPTLSLCATAAAEACELDRTVHKGPTTRQATISVSHTLLCGTTLLYCLHVSPNVISQRVSSRAIRACSGTLAVYSQLFDQARPLYEIFEYLADEILSDDLSQANTRQNVVDAIIAMFNGNFGSLANLYELLKAHKLDPSASQSPMHAQYTSSAGGALTLASEEQLSSDASLSLPQVHGQGHDEQSIHLLAPDADTNSSGGSLDIDWLNLDYALWEYIT